MITKTGFEFELLPDALDDWELVEDIGEISGDSPDMAKAVSVFERLIGKNQYKALKEHVRDENGKVRVSAILAELENIFEVAGEQVKKS